MNGPQDFTLIVTRHPAVEAFLRREWLFREAKVVASATAEDVAGRIIGGNIPLALAAKAAYVVAVEFNGAPPRGLEYDVAAMEAAGAYLRTYKVIRAEVPFLM